MTQQSDLTVLAEASGDPGAFRLVYAALMTTYESSCRVGHMTQFADEVAAIAVRALRQGGRLDRPGNHPPRCNCESAMVPGFPCRPWCATQHQHPGPECPGLCEPEEETP